MLWLSAGVKGVNHTLEHVSKAVLCLWLTKGSACGARTLNTVDFKKVVQNVKWQKLRYVMVNRMTSYTSTMLCLYV